MESLILDNISLIIFLPLWIFLIIMCGRFFSVYVNKNIIYILTLLSSMLGAAICTYALVNYAGVTEKVYQFININEFAVSVGLRVDKLSLVFALLLFVISFAVQIFSISYMKEENKNYKFFAFLNLFNFGMASLLFSPNLFQCYVFWELIGAVSYLLIGFEYKKEDKSQASKRVFLINRIGDTAFIAGIVLTSYYMFSFAENYSFVTLSFEDFNAISTLLLAYTTTPIFYLICVLFILAAAVKSAQIPFYTWLQDAMEAKLPVSALLHSATLVAAGVYLIIRMMPFFTLNPAILKVIVLIGLLTAIVCSILASVETQPKKVLAYSTSANLGLVFIAIGTMNIKIALIFTAVHAFIKSALFILLPREKSESKIKFILYIIFALSLAGILFSGVGVKELLYKNIEYSAFLAYTFMAVCFISAFYISRLTILIYKDCEFINKINYTEMTAFVILLIANVSLYIMSISLYKLAEPYAAAIGGLALALLLGKKGALEKFNQTPKLLEKLYNNTVPAIYLKISCGLSYIDKNILSNYKPILVLSKASVNITEWIENNIMNRSVSLIKDISNAFSKYDKILQSGNVQTYNAYAFIVVTAVITLVIAGYTLIFG